MGYTLVPIISAYLELPNGSQLVVSAMGDTGAILLGLSGHALVSPRDFSFLGGFLMVGILVAFLPRLGTIFFEIPALSPTVSATFVLVVSGLVVYQTRAIMDGCETK